MITLYFLPADLCGKTEIGVKSQTRRTSGPPTGSPDSLATCLASRSCWKSLSMQRTLARSAPIGVVVCRASLDANRLSHKVAGGVLTILVG